MILIALAYGAINGAGYDAATALSATHVAHAILTFVFFHWAKGSPDTFAQGSFDELTVWEQLDGGRAWSPTKRLFVAVPTLLLLLQLNAARFAVGDMLVHVPLYCALCLLPKLPMMHRVRVLGINRTIMSEDIDISDLTPVKKKD